MNDLAHRLEALRERIATAARAAGRDPAEVALLAVGKRHPAARIAALNDLGQAAFGENTVQEAVDKIEALAGRAIEWHFIGALQSNKTAAVATHFDWVQSVDRAKIVRRLDSQRDDTAPPLNVCIQVNVDEEPQKSGVPPDEVESLAALVAEAPHLALRGLMTIPRADAPEAETRASFARLRAIFRQLRDAGYELDTLSMGMSGDLELAIAEGSTMVRVGTDLFGPRPAEPQETGA